MRGEDRIIINSPKEKVWKVILEGSSYFKWNSFINGFDGNLREANRIKLVCLSKDGGKVTYDGVVESLKTESELILNINKGSNKFRYYIKINEIGENETEVIQGKDFYGMCTITKRSYIDKEIKKLKIMNDELKGYLLMLS